MGIAQRDYMKEPPRRNPFGVGFEAVPIIIIINIVVFLLWHLGDNRFTQFMNLNFLTSLTHLEHGRVWTLLTSAFSHEAPWHIFVNMFVFYSFGRVLEDLWGTWRFTIFYLASAVVSSLVFCLMPILGWPEAAALGASGAVTALVTVYALQFPRAKIYLFALVPIPAIAAVAAFVLWGVWGLTEQRLYGAQYGGKIAHAGHLGGAAFALVYFFWARYFPTGRPHAVRRRTQDVHRQASLSPAEAELLDRLLQRISREGIDSLTEEERNFLTEVSQRYQPKR